MRKTLRPRGLIVNCTILDQHVQPCPTSRSDDPLQFQNVPHCFLIAITRFAILDAIFIRADSDEYPARPSLETLAFIDYPRVRHVQRGTFEKQSTKYAGLFDDRIERDESSVGRAAQRGVLAAGSSSVPRVYKRHHLAGKKFGILGSLGICEWWPKIDIGKGKILIRPTAPAGIVDPDDDHGLDLACPDQASDGLIGLPLHRIEDRRRDVEKVLPVVQVENRIPSLPVSTLAISMRKQHADRPRIPEHLTLELVQP